jgi:hypothetical protein
MCGPGFQFQYQEKEKKTKRPPAGQLEPTVKLDGFVACVRHPTSGKSPPLAKGEAPWL